MCQLETHVVLNASEADVYVKTATDYRDLDYNDFSVAAYVNPAANLGPKPGSGNAAGGKGKSSKGTKKSARGASRKSSARRPVDDGNSSSSFSEDDIESHAGPLTPTAKLVSPEASESVWHVSHRLDAPVIDWSNVPVPADSRRAPSRGRAASGSHGRGAGRSSSAPRGGRGRGRVPAPQGAATGRASSLPPSDGGRRSRAVAVPGAPSVQRSLLANYAECDREGDVEGREPRLQRKRP